MIFSRFREIKTLTYRISLVFLFFTLSRGYFVLFNWKFLNINSGYDCLLLFFYGLRFDASAILYTNLIFIFLSLFPYTKSTHDSYQKMLAIIYFTFNFLFISLNYIDLIYYQFTYVRSGISIFESIQNELNIFILLGNFFVSYWYVFILFISNALAWFYLYKRIAIKKSEFVSNRNFYLSSLFGYFFVGLFVFVGMRGNYQKNSVPINLIDANSNLKDIAHTDVVLNTTFVFLRTFYKNSFKKVNFVSEEVIQKKIKPIKQYQINDKKDLNVVLIILESFGREYIGSFQKNNTIKNYKSYTPFLDSLAQHSLIFNNAHANGYKSIHGMTSILSGIPSFKDAFTSSPYPNQEIESLVSILNKRNYDTSFFHGGYNGTMGFLGFANTLGFNHYYGKDEYNNNDDFDGSWAIWDEPFLEFTKKTLDEKKSPFMATIFTATSHEPYKIPKKYEARFKKSQLQIHPCIEYSDYALKRFFDEASKSAWFDNTLFVIVADHTNQTYYEEYAETINRQAIPILFYQPKSNLKGIDNQIAQQIDIYPSIIDYLGYEKPFRSWGRSLFNEKEIPPFCIKYSGNLFHFLQGNYICIFDGVKSVGFYDKNDRNLKLNLIDQINPEMIEIDLACKSFIQDYYNRIIDKKLK